MNLLDHYLALLEELSKVFCQRRTANRAISLMLANLLCLGRRWITRLLLVKGDGQCDWSAYYKLFSRARWVVEELFLPVIRHTIPYLDEGPIVLAGDETRLRRGGRKVKRSRWTRDPMSPPFHVNFMKGIRVMQFSALLPLHRSHGVSSRAVPVSFSPVDLPQKPRKGAGEEEKRAYKAACRKNRICVKALEQLKWLRQAYDKEGAGERSMLAVLDGAFCNQTIFRSHLDRTEFLARCRKDAVLCFPANDPARPRLVYAQEKFTPEQVRLDDSRPWQKAEIFFGGEKRSIRFKEVKSVLWRGGARRRELRLFVVAPTPYRTSPRSRCRYRQPAYLLTTDLSSSAEFLLQCYFDRWQIEVNHRDEKQHIGVADSQVWNDQSVERLPAFMVASYSFLLLASLAAYGPYRTDEYIEPPRWQRRRTRPSCQDLLALIRKQAMEREASESGTLPFRYDPEVLLTRMAA